MEWTPTPTPATPTPGVHFRGGSRPASPPRGPVFAAGQMIGQVYSVVRMIGSGSVGEVYEVEHVDLGRRYAIKVLSEDGEAQGIVRKRFEREARIAASIDHPHVLRILNFERTTTGRRFLVSELLRGRTLADRIANGRLPILEACLIAEQIASALQAAHAQGAIHRDLKPSNIFLVDTDGSPQVKVMDFGLAKAESNPHEADLTVPDALVGTPGYVAPEQIAGTNTIDGRADIYSVGVLLYEMLTGVQPFVEGERQSLLIAHLERPAPDPRDMREEVPAVIASLTRSCLAKDPSGRPASAKDLRKILRAVRKLATQGDPRTRPRYERWIIGVSFAVVIAAIPVIAREMLRVPPVAPVTSSLPAHFPRRLHRVQRALADFRATPAGAANVPAVNLARRINALHDELNVRNPNRGAIDLEIDSIAVALRRESFTVNYPKRQDRLRELQKAVSDEPHDDLAREMLYEEALEAASDLRASGRDVPWAKLSREGWKIDLPALEASLSAE